MRYEVLFNKKNPISGAPNFTPIQTMYRLGKFKIGSSDPTGLSSKSVINIKTGSGGGMTVTVQRSGAVSDAVSRVFYLALPDGTRRL